MKKILFFPALAFALTAASCTSTTEDNTTVNTIDTINSAPGMETTTPATDVNGTMPADNTNGGISTGHSDASMEATDINTGVGTSKGMNPGGRAGSSSGAVNNAGSRSGKTMNTSGRAVVADPADNANTSNPQSTYEQAKPGAPVDGRMPRGTSVEK